MSVATPKDDPGSGWNAILPTVAVVLALLVAATAVGWVRAEQDGAGVQAQIQAAGAPARALDANLTAAEAALAANRSVAWAVLGHALTRAGDALSGRGPNGTTAAGLDRALSDRAWELSVLEPDLPATGLGAGGNATVHQVRVLLRLATVDLAAGYANASRILAATQGPGRWLAVVAGALSNGSTAENPAPALRSLGATTNASLAALQQPVEAAVDLRSVAWNGTDAVDVRVAGGLAAWFGRGFMGTNETGLEGLETVTVCGVQQGLTGDPRAMLVTWCVVSNVSPMSLGAVTNVTVLNGTPGSFRMTIPANGRAEGIVVIAESAGPVGTFSDVARLPRNATAVTDPAGDVTAMAYPIYGTDIR